MGGVQPTLFLAPGHAPYCRASFVLFSLWVAASGLLSMYFTYYVIHLEGYPWRLDYFISCLLLVFFEGVAIFIFVDTVRHRVVNGVVILCNNFKHRGCPHLWVLVSYVCVCQLLLCVVGCGSHFFSVVSIVFFSFFSFLCGQLWVLFFCVWSVVGVVFLCVWPAAGVVLLLRVVGCGSCFFSVVSVLSLCGQLWVLFVSVCGQCHRYCFSLWVWSVVGVVFLCVVSCGVVFLCVWTMMWVLFFSVWSVVGVVCLCVWSVSWVLFFSVGVVSCGCCFSLWMWSVAGVVFLCGCGQCCGCCFSLWLWSLSWVLFFSVAVVSVVGVVFLCCCGQCCGCCFSLWLWSVLWVLFSLCGGHV